MYHLPAIDFESTWNREATGQPQVTLELHRVKQCSKLFNNQLSWESSGFTVYQCQVQLLQPQGIHAIMMSLIRALKMYRAPS